MSQRYACFITFSTYGSRLHGDRRGTVRRNAAHQPRTAVPENRRRRVFEFDELRQGPVLLTDEQRRETDAEIRRVCAYEGWAVHALNVRTNHVHIMVSGSQSPEATMLAFKSWTTRRLRTLALVAPDHRLWTRHGSTRYVWNESEAERVWHYVEHGQDKQPRAE